MLDDFTDPEDVCICGTCDFCLDYYDWMDDYEAYIDESDCYISDEDLEYAFGSYYDDFDYYDEK